MADIPLLEYDADRSPMVDPHRHSGKAELPRRAVICFFDEIIRSVVGDAEPLYHLRWEHGRHGIWSIEHEGEALSLCQPGCGAPLAAANLDVLIAMGCDRFVVCGGAGTLGRGLDMGHVVVVEDAIRDEGTSYHYLPAEVGRTVSASPRAVLAIEAELAARGVPAQRGRTWTTDGLFRETRGKVAARRDEGCITVDMEASALFAVAQFHDVTIGQMLYCGDDLSTETWDHREWNKDVGVRRRLFDVACGAVCRL